MTNNPNDNDPKPLRPTDPAAIPPLPDEEGTDEVRIEDLPDLGPVDLAELSGDLPLDDPAHEGGGIWSERIPDPEMPISPNSDVNVGSFDLPSPSAEPASFADEGFVDLPDPSEQDSDSSHLFRPPANPTPKHDLAGASGNLAPIAPASGWFDASELPKQSDPKLKAEREFTDSDLFGGPMAKLGELVPLIESSDIFSGGHVPNADLAATSDVLLGAALDYATTDIPPEIPGEVPAVGSPSELPLGVMPLPGVESDELRAAQQREARMLEAQSLTDEDVERVFDDSDSLFDGLNAEAPDHFSGDDLPETRPAPTSKPEAVTPPNRDIPKPPHDPDLKELGLTPDFGASPKFTPDASSILADLSVMGSQRFESASEVRLDSPEFGRTIGGDANDGSEFGLELPGEMLSPDQQGRGPQAPDSASIVWSNPDGVSPEDEGTIPEVNLDDALPYEPYKGKATDRTEPSLPPSMMEDSTDVEFTDFPDAEDETASLEAFGSALAQKPITPKPSGKVSKVDSTADLELDDADLEPTQPKPPAKGSKPTMGLSGMAFRRPGQDDPHDAPTKESKAAMAPLADKKDAGKAKTKPDSKSGEGSNPSVEIDWMSGSAPQQPVSSTSATTGPVVVANWGPESIVQKNTDLVPVPVPVREPAADEIYDEPTSELEDPIHTRRTKPDLSMRSDREARRSGKGGWLGGTLVGMVLAGGACAGAYFGNLIPNGEKTTQAPAKQPNPDEATTADGKQPTAADVAAAVRAGDPTTAKKLAAAVKDPSPHLKAAQGEAELFAMLQEQKDATPIAATNPALKVAHQKLKAFLDDPVAKTPEAEKAAVKATIQLGVVFQLAGETDNARKLYETAREQFPKYASTFDAALNRMDATAAPPAPMPDGSSLRLTPADARQLLFAIVLLQDEPPVTPAKEDDTEAGVHFWKAIKMAKFENYVEAVALIKKAKAAHIKQAKAMAGRGLNPLSDPLEQIFPRSCDDLQRYWELQAAISSNPTIADAFKKDGAEKALVELEKRAAGAVKLMTDLKESTDKLTVAAKDLKDAKDLVAKLEKDFKEADEAKVTAEKKLDAEEKVRKGLDEVVSGVVKELQAAKLLPEKFDNAELLAAHKRALDRATGPTLSSLLSPEMMAVGGAGLSTAQLIDIAERMSKSERSSKIASDKLAAEVKRLTAEHAEAMKKLTDAHTTDVSKLKDDQIAELKKAADKYAADSKKQTEGFEAKIKDLDAAVVAEKKRTEDIAAKFKTDLGNAVTPAQAIDLWLPLLVGLRRPSDSEGALAAATKSLTTSQPDSEDVAKARTVAGLALLFQNKYTEAKAQFDAAKTNPNFEAALAAKKLWATATEVGLQSVTDPLAAYRRSPELPARDPAVAARFLDAGIKAYKDGRFKDAVNALTDSTKADATNAVAWYFLGASKMALGSTDEGNDDIRQGAVREGVSNVSTQVISRALSPIQGKSRDAITAARP
ncbi:MAG: hypothetical protein K8U57_29965 [Planctomycetes bacterium]|nr:hypothetical protein [Planctomycetota bacterium]